MSGLYSFVFKDSFKNNHGIVMQLMHCFSIKLYQFNIARLLPRVCVCVCTYVWVLGRVTLQGLLLAEKEPGDGWGTSNKRFRLFSASLLKSAMNKAELGGRCPRGLESLNQGKV